MYCPACSYSDKNLYFVSVLPCHLLQDISACYFWYTQLQTPTDTNTSVDYTYMTVLCVPHPLLMSMVAQVICSFHSSSFLKLVKPVSSALLMGLCVLFVWQKLCCTVTMCLCLANPVTHCAFSCMLTTILTAEAAVLTIPEGVQHMCMVHAQKYMHI